MIDLARLNAIHLHNRPIGQRVFGRLLLTPNYGFPLRRTRIVLEGVANIPAGGGAIFVMNHTDRYNYWPFQYELWRQHLGYTATWVKGKYYENPVIAWFMDIMNNIPIPSKGYLLTKDFAAAIGRLPDDQEYAALKRLLDGGAQDQAEVIAQGGAVAELVRRPWLDTPAGTYAASVEARFAAMMSRVLDINREALAMGLNLLIFPQGTRSIRLTPGHTGAAQVILHTGAPVIPVGCSGSDRAYPGNLPISRGGTIIYRIGTPLTAQGELAPFRISEPFVPFTPSADRFAATFRRLTEVLMDRINQLVDPPYQFAEEDTTEKGARRFV